MTSTVQMLINILFTSGSMKLAFVDSLKVLKWKVQKDQRSRNVSFLDTLYLVEWGGRFLQGCHAQDSKLKIIAELCTTARALED